ncbi:MAG TPA: methylglyoxal synthase [Thermotogota bacterium]|nr:methylglyoxal synthase [Thermotogota bacterium]
MQQRTLANVKHIALIAHDFRKKDLVEWARFNSGTLSRHHLYATGTTGLLLQKELKLPVHCFESGPLGGDQQIGAKITEGNINLLIFFWDPLSPQPHDVDVKALLRIANVYNIPVAANRSTADFLISSPLLDEKYSPVIVDYQNRHRLETLEVLDPALQKDFLEKGKKG